MSSKKFLIIFPIIALLVYLSIYFSPPVSVSNITPSYQSQPTQLPAKTSLVKTHLIKTTFVPQAPEKNWGQPWQDSCEEAALLTNVYFYQKKSPDTLQIKNDLLDILKYEQDQSWPKDINLSKISQIATDHFNLKANIVINPTVEDIKTYISQDTPVLITANGKTLYKENKHFSNGGPYYHALIILGYNDNKLQFTVHDVGTQHGAYFKYTYDTLMESIHDLPQSGDKHDIDTGQKAVLVISRV